MISKKARNIAWALAVLVNYRRQTLAKRLQCETCPFDTHILDNTFGGVWLDFGGGGSSEQLAPRSGRFSFLGNGEKMNISSIQIEELEPRKSRDFLQWHSLSVVQSAPRKRGQASPLKKEKNFGKATERVIKPGKVFKRIDYYKNSCLIRSD